jgi:hypothetical protein
MRLIRSRITERYFAKVSDRWSSCKACTILGVQRFWPFHDLKTRSWNGKNGQEQCTFRERWTSKKMQAGTNSRKNERIPPEAWMWPFSERFPQFVSRRYRILTFLGVHDLNVWLRFRPSSERFRRFVIFLRSENVRNCHETIRYVIRSRTFRNSERSRPLEGNLLVLLFFKKNIISHLILAEDAV